jgi:serine O-acetyltransferase
MNIHENAITKDWLKSRIPQIAARLNQGAPTGDDGLDVLGREEVYEMFDDMMTVLFPGYRSRRLDPGDCAVGELASRLNAISSRLGEHLYKAFSYHCRVNDLNCGGCDCEERAARALVEMVESLPEIREMLLEDVAAALDGDPAAKFFDEVVLSYPCVEAIATHRVAHRLYSMGVPIIPRILSERAHSRTGIDIHPGARIGPRFFIDHGTGVVIGETCRIGANVKIYQGVTLGATSPFDKDGRPKAGQKRHPDIEDDVIIYANATILGGDTVIGKGAIIGGNTWITKSVEPGAHIYNRAKGD